MLSTIVALCHPRENTFRAISTLTLIAVEFILSLLMMPAIPKVMACFIDFHTVMILHNSGQGLLRVNVLVVTMHLCIAVIAEVGRVVIAIPNSSLVLTEITKFNL